MQAVENKQQTQIKFPLVLVEDQLGIRKAMRKIIESMGIFEVQDFSQVKDAITWMKTNHAELVVTDLNLPGETGLDLLFFVRSQPMGNDIPVLFVSGEASKDDIVKSVDLGASDYMLKPFESLELTTKIQKLFNSYKQPSDKIKLFRQAEHLYFHYQYEKAKNLLLPLFENEKSARAATSLAQIEMKMNNLLQANFYVEQSIQWNPMYFPAYSIGAEILIALDRKLEAAKYLLKELEINGKQPHKRVEIANIYFENGQVDNAFEQMRLALVDSPNDEGILLHVAHLYEESGNRDKAVHHALKSRRRNSQSTKSLEFIARIYSNDKNESEAIRIFTDLLNKSPGQYDILIWRSKLHERNNDIEKALLDLNRIPLSIEHLRLQVLKSRLRLQLKLGNMTEAVETSKTLSQYEQTGANYARTGMIYIKLKAFQKAAEAYEKASQLDKKNTDFLFNLGCCYEMLNDVKKATKLYESILSIQSTHEEALLSLRRIKQGKKLSA